MTALEAQGTAVTLGLPFVSPLSESHLIYLPLLSCWTPFFGGAQPLVAAGKRLPRRQISCDQASLKTSLFYLHP